MTPQQLADMEMCFTMMDSDGSGSIDASELSDAFKLLRIRISQAGIAALLANVDKDHTGEIELGEFTEMMTEQLGLAAAAAAAPGQAGSATAMLSLDVVTVGYRRAKLLQALWDADREFLLNMAAAEAGAVQVAQASTAQGGATQSGRPAKAGGQLRVGWAAGRRLAAPAARQAHAVLHKVLGEHSMTLRRSLALP